MNFNVIFEDISNKCFKIFVQKKVESFVLKTIIMTIYHKTYSHINKTNDVKKVLNWYEITLF